MPQVPLPVDAVLPQLVQALRDGPSAVLRAPTGAGKTTHVPSALIDAGLAGTNGIVMLEPRRLAAQTAARRIAGERGGPLGGEVGYHIRFDRRAGNATRILVVTEGILLRMLQGDPFLERFGVVIFDEFHERHLDSDLALAMVRRVQQEARPDLKLVVMSATLETDPVARFVGGSVIESKGRMHPVKLGYLAQEDRAALHETVAAGVAGILDETPGDVLVFLPGVGEIRRTHEALEPVAGARGLVVMELFGDLPLDEQEAVLRPADRRKVVLATNVAETSVTIEGVTGVVDSGLARVLRSDPSVGLNRLEVTRISRASADQRAGRAGRTAPGVCRRLWTEREQRSLRDHEEPEILRVDIAAPLLQLFCWGERDPRRFPWFQAPPEPSIQQAELLLERLGAVRAGAVTETGRRMAELPVHPRLARLLVEAHARGSTRKGAWAAALLSERDPFLLPPGRRTARHASDSDVLDRVQALERFERSGRAGTESGALHTAAARFVLRARDQLERLVRDACGAARDTGNDDGVLRALVAAFPDRVARRRERSGRRARMVGGRGVRLGDASAVSDPELFVCVDIEEIGKPEALVRQASAVDAAWLPADRLRVSIDIEFDAERERVIALRRTRYDDLPIEEAVTDAGDSEAIASALAAHAAKQLDRVLPRDDDRFAQFWARLICLRQWFPELGVPAIEQETLRAILPQLARGRRSFAELRSAPWIEFLKGNLTPAQARALEREAPERIEVPSGSRVALRYEAGRPPVLAVRIQELFGLADTPRIASGRVAVLLHLLAPNMRPQQVTDDLGGFWDRTYPRVRNELRRRYPKHAWPEDPRAAAPRRGARR